jgi:hypothetical protein
LGGFADAQPAAQHEGKDGPVAGIRDNGKELTQVGFLDRAG